MPKINQFYFFIYFIFQLLKLLPPFQKINFLWKTKCLKKAHFFNSNLIASAHKKACLMQAFLIQF